MQHTNGDLLTLVQLLEGRLSSAEGVAVRERLADDPQLRQQWQLLSTAASAPFALDDLDLLGANDPTTVAAFVEGGLSEAEARSFEQSCWKNAASLREVVHAFRSLSEVPLETVAPSFTSRLMSVVGEECSTGIHEPEKPKQARTTKTSSHAKANGTKNGYFNGRKPQLPPRKRRTPSRQQQPAVGRQRKQIRLLAAVAMLVALGLTLFFALQPSSPDRDAPLVNDPQAPPPAPVLPDAPDEIRPNDSGDPIVDRKAPDTQIVVPQPDRTPPDSAPTPHPKPPAGELPVMVRWTDVQGIAARREKPNGTWQGILAQTSNREPSQAVTLRTLPRSWAQGELIAGRGFVLDADTELRFDAKREQAAASPVTIHVKVTQGQVALNGMHAGDRVRIQLGNQSTDLTVKEAGAAIGIAEDDGGGKIFAWVGETTVGDIVLNGGQELEWKGQAFSEPTDIKQLHEWWLRPQTTFPMTAKSATAVNRSDDLLAALERVRGTSQPRDIVVAANVSFSLDAVAGVSRAATSNDAPRRAAAIRWLMKAPDNAPLTNRVWAEVASAAGVTRSKLAVRSWFRSAQRKARPSDEQLRDLSVGLMPRNSVFVRECSIHFFREITGLPLAEYNPENPTKPAMDSVRQKVRRVLNRRPGGTRQKTRPTRRTRS